MNGGIWLLLMAPYLAIGIAGYVWRKKYKRKNVDLRKMREQQIHLN